MLQVGPGEALNKIIKPKLPSFFGICFESLCREFLPLAYAKMEIRSEYQIEEFWSKEVQIDIVGIRQDGWIDIGECKWGTTSSRKKLVQLLNEKVAKHPNKSNSTILRWLFTHHPLKPVVNNDEPVMQYCLKDMYGFYA